MEESLFTAHHALEERHWWFRARRKAIVRLGSALIEPGGHIVDVGCGTGADIAAFPTRYRRTGLDRSASAIRFARQRHAGVDFDVAELPDTGGEVIASADLILLCDVLEHVEHDRALMRWLVATMRPGAHLLLTVPADPKLWSPHDVAYGHHRRYTRQTLATLWHDVPVDVRLLAPFNRLLYPVARVVRTVAARRGRGHGQANSDLALPWAPLNWLLEHTFGLEVPGLERGVRHGRPVRGRRSVSLLAVLRVKDVG